MTIMGIILIFSGIIVLSGWLVFLDWKEIFEFATPMILFVIVICIGAYFLTGGN